VPATLKWCGSVSPQESLLQQNSVSVILLACWKLLLLRRKANKTSGLPIRLLGQ
jgi:hypothetical protein